MMLQEVTCVDGFMIDISTSSCVSSACDSSNIKFDGFEKLNLSFSASGSIYEQWNSQPIQKYYNKKLGDSMSVWLYPGEYIGFEGKGLYRYVIMV